MHRGFGSEECGYSRALVSRPSAERRSRTEREPGPSATTREAQYGCRLRSVVSPPRSTQVGFTRLASSNCRSRASPRSGLATLARDMPPLPFRVNAHLQPARRGAVGAGRRAERRACRRTLARRGDGAFRGRAGASSGRRAHVEADDRRAMLHTRSPADDFVGLGRSRSCALEGRSIGKCNYCEGVTLIFVRQKACR